MNASHGLPSPLQLVIFGAAGDVTWRKIAPALYNLYLKNILSDPLKIVGLDLKEMREDDFRDQFLYGINSQSANKSVDKTLWNIFAEKLNFMSDNFSDPSAFQRLSSLLDAQENQSKSPGIRIYYLAVPPGIAELIINGLGQTRLSGPEERARIVIEKPFGHDLEPARKLNCILLNHFSETQIYRIDHYLGKETFQNILAFLFANALFEPLWDHRYIDHVQITVSEQVGVEHRSAYYEHADALRDMIQNHLIQILCFIAMEPLISFEADEIRGKEVDLLRDVRPFPLDIISQFCARGQYDDNN
jgi:glucose-6-phosphate 1-dehydrogenase